MNISIDIIIPCYNSHDTIDRCLGSILCQRVLPSIKVTLVRDGGKGYKDIIKRYSPVMDIQQIGYDKNGGPAVARNYGMTHTSGDLIMFMDSDDSLAGPFSVIDLVNGMYEEPGTVIGVADFIEEVAPMHFKHHTEDSTFVHGKMYRRDYLERNNILFNANERTNEDVSFNILSLILMKPNEKVKYIKKVCHYWLCNPSSIVRSNKDEFDHSISVRSFIRNIAHIYDELEKRNLQDDRHTLLERVASMSRVCNMYAEKLRGYEQYQKENFEELKRFYKKVYQLYEHLVTKEMTDMVFDKYPFKNVFQLSKEELANLIKSLGEEDEV